MIDYSIEKYIVDGNETILSAMGILTKNRQGIGFICENDILTAVISDGDIRRYLIKGGNLNVSARTVANYNPRFVFVNEEDKGENILDVYDCAAVPVVDHKRQMIGIIVKEILKFESKRKINVPVVIMAGGKGSRLKPFTDVLPKPLIPIGDKTILERIIDNFREYGCDRFMLIVNYKKNLIRTYFEGEENNYNLEMYEEEKFLGTAGGLKLIEDKIGSTFFVSNCDILVDCDYAELYDIHKKEKSIITVVCTRKRLTIPYGVVETDKSEKRIIGLSEKPEHEILINTGLYVLEPDVLQMIPENVFIHITDLIENCISKGKYVGIYIVDSGKWLDMGQFSEMGRMKDKLLL